MIQQSIQLQFAAAERAIATMKAAGDKNADELVSIAMWALTAFERGRPADRDVIPDQELMLYAAREPDLRGPYLSFVDTVPPTRSPP